MFCSPCNVYVSTNNYAVSAYKIVVCWSKYAFCSGGPAVEASVQAMIAGRTGSGKTVFVRNFVQKLPEMVKPVPYEVTLYIVRVNDSLYSRK